MAYARGLTSPPPLNSSTAKKPQPPIASPIEIADEISDNPVEIPEDTVYPAVISFRGQMYEELLKVNGKRLVDESGAILDWDPSTCHLSYRPFGKSYVLYKCESDDDVALRYVQCKTECRTHDSHCPFQLHYKYLLDIPPLTLADIPRRTPKRARAASPKCPPAPKKNHPVAGRASADVARVESAAEEAQAVQLTAEEVAATNELVDDPGVLTQGLPAADAHEEEEGGADD